MSAVTIRVRPTHSSGEVTGLSDENLAKLQGDPRVLAHTRKQEL